MGEPWDSILAGGLIFLLRIGDVSLGTLRTMLMVQGRRTPAVMLAVCESTIWVLAISKVMSASGLDDPFRIAGYACGFAAGTLVGMTAERMIGIGRLLVRVISREHGQQLREALLEQGFGLTSIHGMGRDGSVLIHFVVAPRRRLRGMLRTIQQIDPEAFVTHEPVHTAYGGFVPSLSEVSSQKR